MAVGTTDTWSSSRDEIITDALANVGVVSPGDTATGKVRDHAARALDRIVKAIDADGQFLWRTARLTFATVAATASYTLSATALDVDAPISYLRSGTTSRVPLSPMSRDDYMALPDRTTAVSLPSRYFIEKTLSGGRTAMTMYLYGVPNATGDTVEYAASIRAKDFNTGATTPDFPSNWTKCLVYGLTAELAGPYGQADLIGTYAPMFMAEKNAQLANDNEKQSTFFVPFGGSGY